MSDIIQAKYLRNVMSGELCGIQIDYDTYTVSCPLNPENSDYAEIMRQVEAGELTIQPADGE